MFQRLALAMLVAGLLTASATAEMAKFDDVVEGFGGTSLTNGGIVFYGYDARHPSFPAPNEMNVDRADADLSGPFFSSPNVLNFFSYSPGPHLGGYGRCGEFRFKLASGLAFDHAALELFEGGAGVGNHITLEARRAGSVVNSMTVNTLNTQQHWTLAVSGVPFDELRVVGTGPNNQGCFFAVADNVVITPEPTALLLLGLGGLALRRR